MKFADIPGHEDVKRRLRDMADSGRLPHALLLEGAEGTGKFMLARALAQYIHCTDRHDGDSCGRCAACRQTETFNNVDVVYSFPIVKGKSQNPVSDDYLSDFKTFLAESPYMDFATWVTILDNINARPQIYVSEAAELQRRLSYRTRSSKYKTVLMWLPERFAEPAANKLLKLIEEPYDDTIFIMSSDTPRLILPTIYSRTRRIEVPRRTDAELTAILRDMGFGSDAAADLVRIAEGSVAAALRMNANKGERNEHRELFISLMRNAYAKQVTELRKWSLKCADMGREPAVKFIDYCTRMVRESFIMHLADTRLQTVNAEENKFLQRFHPFINHLNVEDIISYLDNARRNILANANAKIVFFEFAVRMIILLRRQP